MAFGKRWALAALALCLALTLCSCGLAQEGNTLLTAPVPDGDTQQLMQTVYTYLGSGITLKYPVGGNTSSPFFWWDADGDGADELMVLYQNTAKSKNVQLALLQPALDGGWYVAHMDIEGTGGEVAGLQALRLANGQRCLLTAYQDSTGRDWTLCFYQWQNGALVETVRLVCQQYAVVELQGDGCHQVAVVQQSSVHGLLQLRVYGGVQPQEDKTSDSLLAELAATTLDARFDRCQYMAYSPMGSELTLVMDFLDGSGNSLGEVATWRQDRFIRCYTPDDSNIPNFTARPFSGLEPMDINGDGSIELPCVDSRVVGGGGNRFYFVSWYAIGMQSTQLQGYSLVDITGGCLVQLPMAWHGQVMLQPVSGSVWSLQSIRDGGELLSFQMDATDRAPAGYRLWGDLGRQRLYVQFSQGLSSEEQALLLAGFCPLYR